MGPHYQFLTQAFGAADDETKIPRPLILLLVNPSGELRRTELLSSLGQDHDPARIVGQKLRNLGPLLCDELRTAKVSTLGKIPHFNNVAGNQSARTGQVVHT